MHVITRHTDQPKVIHATKTPRQVKGNGVHTTTDGLTLIIDLSDKVLINEDGRIVSLSYCDIPKVWTKIFDDIPVIKAMQIVTQE